MHVVETPATVNRYQSRLPHSGGPSLAAQSPGQSRAITARQMLWHHAHCIDRLYWRLESLYDGFPLLTRSHRLTLRSYESSLRGTSRIYVVLSTTIAGLSLLDIVSQSKEAQSDEDGSLQVKCDQKDLEWLRHHR